MEAYVAFRRDGGEPQTPLSRLITNVGQALRSQGETEALRLIPTPEQFAKTLIQARDALLAIVRGSRDPALAQDTRLNFEGAVELSLLLESLAGSEAV